MSRAECPKSPRVSALRPRPRTHAAALGAHDAATQRVGIALVQVLGLSVWFSATAVSPSLTERWQLSSTQATWLTAVVQVGFVCGAVASAATRLADRVPATRLMAGCAALAGLATLGLAFTAQGYEQALVLRGVTGVFLAGVYPVGMKLTASWSEPDRRGSAFGLLLAALTLGSAMPHLLGVVHGLPWRAVLAAAGALAIAGASVAYWFVVPGPWQADVSAKLRTGRVLRTLSSPGPLMANLGYFGHMWELYALWTWLPTFLSAAGRTGSSVHLLSFVAIGVAGAAGCLLGGMASDRFGRSPAACVAMLVSGACCLLSPWAFEAATWIVAVFVIAWGASVIADSGVFSTALTETADPDGIGTALTVQTAVGFSTTIASIHLVGWIGEHVGWQLALVVLAPGPLLGAVAMRTFGRLALLDGLDRGRANGWPVRIVSYCWWSKS